MELRHLKSGTDVRGTAVNPDDPKKIDLTDEAVKRISAAFVVFLAEKLGKKEEELVISVGHDSRISAERIKSDVIDALSFFGLEIKDCALASTPAMFMTTKMLGCDGAVQITASHHPWDRNGLKFFTPDGGLSGDEIKSILEYAEEHESGSCPESLNLQEVDFMSVYCEHLCNMIRKGVKSDDYERPLKGLKIVVDAGNGVGGFYAEKVLSPLGADTTGSRYLEPDGMFPNHIPNPENETAMNSVREATLGAKADLGVIFDTDVDRGGCVSSDGREINRNALVALAAVIALENNPGGTVVTDSVTSAGLTEFIEKTLGGHHLRFKRGYKNVIDEAIRLEENGINAPLAIETSGHAAFRENYYLDDGAYLITKIIIKAADMKKQGKKLYDLISELKYPAEEKEIRLKITEEDFRAVGDRLLEELADFAAKREDWQIAPDSHEGIKIIFPKTESFFILRQSVHDPVIPINFESAQNGGVKKAANSLYEFIKDFDGVDISPLKQIL